jgi:hypothetical protein
VEVAEDSVMAFSGITGVQRLGFTTRECCEFLHLLYDAV